jgi:multicomponent Na+:H+ antiporter subunit A
MAIAVFSGFVASAAAPWLHKITRNLTGWVIALLPLALFIYFAALVGPVAEGEVFSTSYAWVPSLGINLSFYLDGLSLLFGLLITGVGAAVMVYAGGYLAGHPHLGRFYTFILMFMASMLGVVLSNNIFTLFIFWELTSLSSYFLIGFDHEQDESRTAALQALLVTAGGGLALLAGLILLSFAGGTAEISELLMNGEMIRRSALYLPALLLILLGAFTKSAQFPFHFWLPNAMAAPTPVSAYLHSATMVKAGVYLLARFSLPLGGTEAWLLLVTGTGVVTMLLGAYLALAHNNLKRILAYSTISSLGVMVLLLGIGASGAVKAAIVFLLAHALYKGAMFMIAGSIYHETGTQNVEELGGLRRRMPILAVVAVLGAISLSGLGPVISFIGKELLFEAVLEEHRFWFIFTPAAVLVGAVSVAVALIVTLKPFFGPHRQTPKEAHDAPLSLWLGPGVLAGLGILIGFFPALVSETLVAPAVWSVLGERVSALLALWHGANLALGLSGVAILLGLLFYRFWGSIRLTHSSIGRYLQWGPEWLYYVSLDWMNTLARFQTGLLQSGKLHHYLFVIILTTVVLVGYTFVSRGGGYQFQGLRELRYYEIGLGVLILLGVLSAIRSNSRLAAVASLGVIGYGVALTFVFYGAPDLAMTQIMVETMTVILMVLIFYHLPNFARLTSRRQRALDAVAALAAGILMTFLVLIATSHQEFPPISDFFAEHAVDLAHGRNIVNVILVDFRALDTLGEITVLSLAAVGVYALLKLRVGKEKKKKG